MQIYTISVGNNRREDFHKTVEQHPTLSITHYQKTMFLVFIPVENQKRHILQMNCGQHIPPHVFNQVNKTDKTHLYVLIKLTLSSFQKNFITKFVMLKVVRNCFNRKIKLYYNNGFHLYFKNLNLGKIIGIRILRICQKIVLTGKK